MLAEHGAPVNLKDTLMLALQAELPAEAEPIIEYLVGNLDEAGYLRCTVEEAASVLQVDVAQVEQVLIYLQAQEPSGVGARTVRECLLLQLRSLEVEGRCCPYAYKIVDRFLESLAQRKYALIARELGIHRQQVEQVGAFLKQQLTPFPASQYVREASGDSSRHDILVPQVVIRRQSSAKGNRYTVEVVEAERFHLQINPVYLEVYREVQGQPDRFQAADRAHLQRHVGYARLLLLSLRKRWQTLGRITQYLVDYQQAFLEQGNGALRPLTRAQVAAALGVHPSTVSRASADKYVLLPNKRVAPFSIFFEANLPIKEVLKEVLAQETKPLSDQRLTEVMAARGHQVARRTLAKYRAELRVPASLCR
jgi:RNA polymerase sigma-54 factor